jgi:hypothetical protein
MKKLIISCFAISIILFSVAVFATSSSQLGTISTSISTKVAETGDVVDNSLVDIVEKQTDADLMKELKDAKDSLKLQSVKTCESFDTILTKWIEKNNNFFVQPYYGGGRPMPVDAVMEDSAMQKTTMAPTANSAVGVGVAKSSE